MDFLFVLVLAVICGYIPTPTGQLCMLHLRLEEEREREREEPTECVSVLVRR